MFKNAPLESLHRLRFQRVINEDPDSHFFLILGSFAQNEGQDPVDAIVRVEKTALNVSHSPDFLKSGGLVDRAQLDEVTDDKSSFFAWFREVRDQDLKINIICPATEAHIRKYTKQDFIMVNETPEIYETLVKPYIHSFPPSRNKWIYDILTGISQKDKVLYSSDEFLIVPDIKWDMQTISSLYLLAIVRDPTILSLRSLRKRHLGMLKAIRKEALAVASSRWGVKSLRMHIHYQPTYFHFHVHIVNANYQGAGWGILVGHAHLLDDVISLLELDHEDGLSIFERRTLTYALGSQHGLYAILKGADSEGVHI